MKMLLYKSKTLRRSVMLSLFLIVLAVYVAPPAPAAAQGSCSGGKEWLFNSQPTTEWVVINTSDFTNKYNPPQSTYQFCYNCNPTYPNAWSHATTAAPGSVGLGMGRYNLTPTDYGTFADCGLRQVGINWFYSRSGGSPQFDIRLKVAGTWHIVTPTGIKTAGPNGYTVSQNLWLMKDVTDIEVITYSWGYETVSEFALWAGPPPSGDNISGLDRPLLAEDTHSYQYWSNSWDDGSVTEEWCEKLTVFPFNALPFDYGECWENRLAELELNNIRAGRLSVEAPPHVYTFPSDSAESPDVYSVMDGTVVRVIELNAAGCAYYGLGLNTECTIELPPYASGLSRTQFFTINDPVYVVQVLSSTDILVTYILSEPNVSEGDSIAKGCMLGRAPSVSRRVPLPWMSGVDRPEFTVADGITAEEKTEDLTHVVLVGAEEIEAPGVYPLLSDQNFLPVSWAGYPERGLACNIDPEFSGCVSINPQFENDGQYWEQLSLRKDRFAEWTNPGVIIPPGGGIKLPRLNLDNQNYGASLVAVSLGGPTTIRLFIGTAEYEREVPTTPTSITIEPTAITPDDGLLTNLQIGNFGDYDVRVSYYCLHAEDVRQGVSSCILNNYSFATALAGWTTQSGTVVPRSSPGQSDPDLIHSIDMGRDSTIYQAISLYPTPVGPRVYQIQVRTFRLGVNSTLQIRIGNNTVATFNPAAGYSTNTYSYTVTSPEEDVRFFLTAGGDTADDGVNVAKVCITGGGGGIGGYGIPEGCEVVPTPNGTVVAEWLIWHWGNLGRFYNCTLMPLLSSWYSDFRTMVKSFTDIGFFFMQTTHKGVTWLGTSFVPWLGGYLSNISPGTIVINQGPGAECAPWDLACYVTKLIEPIIGPIAQFIGDVLGLFVQLLSFILSLLGALVSLVFSVFDQLVGLIGVVFQYILGIGTAYTDATPATVPGMPDCLSGPSGGPVCTGYWILENTIFSGTGAFYIPLIAGVGYILLFISLFKRARGLVIRAADRI